MSDAASSSPTSGVDLARVVLRNARAAAKASPQKPRRTGAAPSRQTRSGEREPQALGTAISRMMTERGLEAGATAGTLRRTVLSQWRTIAPELHGKVQAVQYDPITRTLHLRPCSPAYRTQLTLYQRQIVDRVNATAGADIVAALKILPPGPTDLQEPLNHAPAVQPPAAPAARPTADRPGVPRTRDPGYLAALTAHQQTWDGRQQTDPLIRAKVERQIRERIREPEHRFVEGRRANSGRRTGVDAADRPASSDARRARALKQLAEERAAAVVED
ncbi:DciA family protein [Streptomyces microflavus]|uniref:DciA family protein n=1 Tax=Streptomyces microflavus TaxID=1919 RepID=UPI00225925F8|nr:DciA family protein [Streptomyces microflavus]MCX4657355.1 DciA family protein [Streptomyces microflavus]